MQGLSPGAGVCTGTFPRDQQRVGDLQNPWSKLAVPRGALAPPAVPHMAWLLLATPGFQMTPLLVDRDGLLPTRAGRGACTHIDGAAEEGALLQGLLDDPEQVGRGLPELVPLGDAPREVLEALSGGAP